MLMLLASLPSHPTAPAQRSKKKQKNRSSQWKRTWAISTTALGRLLNELPVLGNHVPGPDAIPDAIPHSPSGIPLPCPGGF